MNTLIAIVTFVKTVETCPKLIKGKNTVQMNLKKNLEKTQHHDIIKEKIISLNTRGIF